jgi:outer membrane protein assembly factor BamB
VASAADWPQHLGPHRDGTVQTETTLEPWADSGPRVLWRRPVGEGFAAPVIADGLLVMFHRVGQVEVLEALDPASGETRWKQQDATGYRDDFGFNAGPRATPTIDRGVVFAVGAEGTLRAVSLADGKELWTRNPQRDYDVPKGFFGFASGPLVDGDLVLLGVGGKKAGIVAFDRATGKTVWTATTDEASYSSPVIGRFAGNRSALFFTREGLVALDPATGELRGRHPWKTRIRASVNAANPLSIGPRVFLSASYGAGAVLLDVSRAEPEVIWSGDDSLTNHYATSVHRDGFLYGFHGRQEARPAFRCIELNTGKVRWSVDRYGAGSVLLVTDRAAGAQLLLLREDGTLVLAEASPVAFRPLAESPILDGEVRAYPAFDGTRLFARSARELVAVELGAGDRNR